MTDQKGGDVVCHRCFRDKRLREWIKEEGTRGTCPWCSRTGLLVPLVELSETFREVARLYVPVEGPDAYREGELIGALLDESWGVFDEKIQVEDLVQDLTIAILYADLRPKERLDYPDYEGFFRFDENRLENHWDEKAYAALRGELPDPATDGGLDAPFPDQIAIAFEDIATTLNEGEVLYRARIFKERTRKTRFERHELGAPPSGVAKAGRANRHGEPLLYLATNKSTALAEVRAWKGAAVALVPVRIKRRLLVVDLKKQRPLKSPFFVELLSWRLDLAVLLRRLGEDMSRPVMPCEEDVLYRPTQLLASLIQSSGYDGFIYPSAMGSGSNVALFNEDNVELMDESYLRIKRVAYFADDIGPYEELYEVGPYDYLFEADL